MRNQPYLSLAAVDIINIAEKFKFPTVADPDGKQKKTALELITCHDNANCFRYSWEHLQSFGHSLNHQLIPPIHIYLRTA
jgi:hypothetical protein